MIKTVGLGLAAALACFALTAPAMAQTENPTGSRVGRPKPAAAPTSARMSDEVRGLRTTFDFAQCLYLSSKEKLRAELRHGPVNSESLTPLVVKSDCLRGGDLTMPTPLIMGAIYRTFYIQELKDVPLDNLGEPINYFASIDTTNPDAVFAATLADFSSCVVRADPANAKAFVTGIPGEPQFENALKLMIPQLGPCMVEGLEVTFNKSNIAATISTALYWEAKAVADAQKP